MLTGYYGTILVVEARCSASFYSKQCSVPFVVPRSLLANLNASLTGVSDALFAGKAQVQCTTDYLHLFTTNTLLQFC